MRTIPLECVASYPKNLEVDAGAVVTVRPMQLSDLFALRAFFLTVPAAARLQFREDVVAERTLEQWNWRLDAYRTLALPAWRNGSVAAFGSLHFFPDGPWRDVGEVGLVLGPTTAASAVGVALLHELADAAFVGGIDQLTLEAVRPGQEEVIKAATDVGFQEAGNLHNALKDPGGDCHDLVLLQLPLANWLGGWAHVDQEKLRWERRRALARAA